MSYQDIGIRVLVLGVAEGRRSIGMFRSDIGGLEREIRSLSATSAGIGTSLTNLGSALVGIGRTLSIAVTLPIAAMGGSLFRAGIEFEDSFAGVSKTVEGVAYGFREVIANDPAIQQMYLRWQALQFPIRNASNAIWDADETMHRFILSLSAADRAMIMSSDLFGQLTPAGEGLRNEFRNMALDIPISAKEIARIGEIAGQLGVPLGEGGQTLEEFTRIIALMGVTTDYATEDAAFAIARLGNIMGVEGTDLGDFAAQAASAIVALGNVSAATEPEIGNLALRIGAAGRLSGLTVPEILGISTTLAEMGIKAERGGTAVSRVLEEMIISIGEGGEGLQAFATIAGVSTAEFSENFRRDAVGTMKDFLVRMAEIQETGAPGLKQMLIDMGLSGVRVKEVMALLGLNMEALDENIEIANQAWEEQIALEEEAAKRFKTTKSQIQLMKNAFVDIGITLFDLYKNKFDNLIGKIREFALAFKKLTPANQKFLVTLGLLAAAAGPVVVVLGLFIQNLGILITALTALPSLLIRVGMLMLTQFLPVLGLLGAAAGVFYALYATNFLGIGDLIDSLGQKFKELYNSYISGSIAAVAKALKEGDFIGALNIIKGTLQSLALLFKIYFLPEIEAWADTAGKTIEEKIQQWTENLPATFAGLAEQLGEAMKTIGSSIANAVLSEEDQSKIDKFYDETIVANWDKLREWIDNNDGPLQSGLKSIYNGIKSFVTNFLKNVDTKALEGAVENIIKAFGAAFLIATVVVAIAAKVWENVAPILGTALGLIVSAVAEVIAGDFDGAAEKLKKLVGEVMAWSKPAIEKAAENARLLALGITLLSLAFLLDVSEKAKGLTDQLSIIGGTLISNAYTNLKNIVDQLQTIAGIVLDTIIGAISSLVEDILKFGSETVNKAATNLGKFVDEAERFIKTNIAEAIAKVDPYAFALFIVGMLLLTGPAIVAGLASLVTSLGLFVLHLVDMAAINLVSLASGLSGVGKSFVVTGWTKVATLASDAASLAVSLVKMTATTILSGISTLTTHFITLAINVGKAAAAAWASLGPYALLALAVLAVQTNFGGVKDKLKQVGDGIKEGDLKKTLDGIVDSLTAIPIGIATWIGDQVGINVPEGLKSWKTNIKLISLIIEAIPGYIDSFIEKATGIDVGEGWETFKLVITLIKSALLWSWTYVSEFVQALLDIVVPIAWDAFKETITNTWDNIKEIPGKIGEFISQVADIVMPDDLGLIEDAFAFIKSGLEVVPALIEGFINWLGKIKMPGALQAIADAIAVILNAPGWVIDKITGGGGDGTTPYVPTASDFGTQSLNNRMRYDRLIAQGLPPEEARIESGFNAHGGNFSGWSMVGEQGPELVFSRNNSLVIPNNWSNKIMELINRESLLTNSINRLVDRNYLGSGPQYAYYQPTFQGTPSAEMRQVNNDMYHQWLVTTGRA